MNMWKNYLFLQIKRAGKLLPAVCLFALALCAGIAFLLGALFADSENDKMNIRFRIGVVGDTEESYLGFGISALQTLDSSRHTIDFIELTDEEADKQLKAGDLDAYIVIPEDFVSAIVRGEVRQLTYVTTPQAADFSTLIRDELLTTVSVMMIESQKGLYGFINATNALQAKNRAEHLDRLNMQYFAMILARASLCEVEVIGMTDGVSLAGYLLCGLTVFFLLLSGSACCSFCIYREKSLSRLLYAAGMPVWVQILCEYIAYICILLPSVLLPLALLLGVSDPMLWIPEWDNMLLPYILQTGAALLCLGTMQFCLYELTNNWISSILLQFTASLVLAYVSGCLYPLHFFPDTIQTLASWLPSGAARTCLAAVLNGDSASAQWFLLIAYAAVFLTATVLIRRNQLHNETGVTG